MNAFANWEDVPLFDSEEAEAEHSGPAAGPDLRLMESAVTARSQRGGGIRHHHAAD